MKAEFLEDYSAKEIEQQKEFLEILREGKFREYDRYPFKNRLKLTEPYTTSMCCEKVWCQIPLYGTTIIELQPIEKNNEFERFHGFEIDDIDRLIDLSKTGKVSFVLGCDPKKYKNMDFLESIFTELRPPQIIHTLKPSYIVQNTDEYFNKVIDWEEEFFNLSDFGFFKWLLEKEKEPLTPIERLLIDRYRIGTYQSLDVITILCRELSVLSNETDRKNFIFKKMLSAPYCNSYAALRLLGYEDIAEEVAIQLSLNPANAALILNTAQILIRSHLSPLREIISISRDYNEAIQQLMGIKINQTSEFPCEVGNFLIDKLKLIVPKNIDGAIELSDEYALYDLRKVMNALNEGINEGETDAINDKLKDVYTIFENVWIEADRFGKHVNNFSNYGISFGLAAIGTTATLPIGGIGGLLAGLGFTVLDKSIEGKLYRPISERILKWTTPNHIFHVYDFKKKYKLKKI